MLYFGRNRDECLLLWCGDIEKLNYFHKMLNTVDQKLKITMEIGGNSICFLDLKISIQNNCLETTVYSKTTDSHISQGALSCRKKSFKNSITKGVALRSRRICSTMEDVKIKSSEYIAYLVAVARRHSAKLVKSEFDKVSTITRLEVRKVEKSFENKVRFTSTFNPQGRNVSQIINRHLHLIKNSPFLLSILPDGSILVANKRCQNLKDLLVRGDPYNIKHDLTAFVPHQYKNCRKKCDSCDNFVGSQSYVTSNVTGKKYYICRDSTCSTPNVVYLAYCKKRKKQGVGFTISWKPRLRNYKSYIKKNVGSCKIVAHFIDACCDEKILLKYLAFVIIEVVNNTSGLTSNQIENRLLEKEEFWIGTLVTQQQGLNSTHNRNRSKQTKREKKSIINSRTY